jgi:LysM repeat protein
LDFKFVVTSLSAFHKISTSSIRFQGKLLVRCSHYNIKSSAIYDLNLIPGRYKIQIYFINSDISIKTKNTVSSIENTYPEKNHSVLSKETLYGIARQYGVTVEDLNKLNPAEIRIEKEIKSESQEPNQIKT